MGSVPALRAIEWSRCVEEEAERRKFFLLSLLSLVYSLTYMAVPLHILGVV